jgi:UrcA family protein
MRFRSYYAPLAFAAVAILSVPATAGGTESISTAVRYGDLDLASAEGAASLKLRLARAARRVCVQQGDHSLHALAFERKCRREALAKANAEADRLIQRQGSSGAN